MHNELLQSYEQGSDSFRAMFAGLTPEQLQAFPVPGTWSLQQIALHVLDSDLVIADRMKRVIAEDRPLLIAYDETRFAASLHYDQQPIDEVASLFALNRKHVSRILRRLAPDIFQRTGIHTERGTVSLAQLVQGAIDHLEHHRAFVVKKRGLLGRPL
jgi:uncharacterized damage-inducible protein DinB